MKFQTDSDYIKYYSEKMITHPELFSQQKKFIESQMEMSRSIFSNWKGKDFKKKCREYLRARGVIL
jgi:hypothetical protein